MESMEFFERRIEPKTNEDGARPRLFLASYDEAREQWIVVYKDADGSIIALMEYSGRLTAEDALDAAERLWEDSGDERRLVRTVDGCAIGRVTAVDLPRFRVRMPEGDIWLRVDAIFCQTPEAIALVCTVDELDRYRTEVTRASTAGRTVICGWCQEAVCAGRFPAMYGICTGCEVRKDLGTFPYGGLVHTPRGDR